MYKSRATRLGQYLQQSNNATFINEELKLTISINQVKVNYIEYLDL